MVMLVICNLLEFMKEIISVFDLTCNSIEYVIKLDKGQKMVIVMSGSWC